MPSSAIDRDWETDRGIKSNSSVSVILKGPPTLDKAQLVALAAKIAEDRLKDDSNDIGRVLSARLVDHMEDCHIEFHVTSERIGDGKVSVANLKARGFASTLDGKLSGYDSRRTVIPSMYGDGATPIGLILSALSDPCSPDGKRIPQGLDSGVSNQKIATGSGGSTNLRSGYVPSRS